MQFYTLSFCALLVVIIIPSSHLYAIKFAYKNVVVIPPTRKPSNNESNSSSVVPISLSTVKKDQNQSTTNVATVLNVERDPDSSEFESENISLEDNVLVVEQTPKQNTPEEMIRDLLCSENNTEDNPTNVRYDLQNGICAEVGEKGHCGNNMIFKEEIDSPAYGFCDCDFEGNSVPLVYHSKSKSCHFVYTQAFCLRGEWLAFNRKAKKAVCEPNKCINIKSSAEIQPTQKELARSKEHSSFPQWVPLNGNGSCVKLNAAADNCDQDEEVLFSRYDIFPRCAIPRPLFRSILPNPCPIGSYYSIIGRCQPDWDF